MINKLNNGQDLINKVSWKTKKMEKSVFTEM